MNPTIASCRWFHWRPKNQKSDPLPSPLWLNHSNIWSMGTDSVIQKFFFFWTDLSPCYCFDSLWSCCFYLGYHHQKEGKKYQHLSISSYLNIHFSILSIQELDNHSICLSQPMTSNNTWFVKINTDFLQKIWHEVFSVFRVRLS